MPQVETQIAKEEELSEELKKALERILEMVELEDQYVRYRHIYEAKQNDLYWHGFQYIYWDSQSQEFRVPTHEDLERIGSSREEAKFVYDYVTNIFKAHGLSIIAAIGSELPGVVFSPEDADEPNDLRAAKKAEKLAKLIHRKNKSKIHLLHSLFILFTQHLVAAYNYYDRDKKYGTVDVPKFKKEMQKVSPDISACPECEFASEEPVESCPECGSSDMDIIPGRMEEGLTAAGSDTIDKGVSRFSVYGDLNVRVPSYAEDQESCGYLIHYTDQHISYLRHKYPKLKDKLSVGSEKGTNDAQYERLARSPSSSQYYAEVYTNNLITVKKCWFRLSLFDILDSSGKTDDLAEQLKKKFPNGVKVVFAGDKFAESKDEDLDSRWSLTKGDLSRTVHGDPLGKSLIQIQDIRNTTSNLLLESLEHSIPINIADPEVLNFETLSDQEVKPGLTYPGKKKPGSTSMSDSFYQFKSSTLPKEGVELQRIIDQDAQFVMASFPSVFGGPQEGGKTLGEYTESRNYALQRLSIPYQFIYEWWAQLTHKAVLLHIENMIEDERHTLPSITGGYESGWIYREDFKGRFELLIPESSVELPVSYGQKRAIIIQAVQLNSEEINAFLFAPERIRVTLKYLGFDEFTASEEIQTIKAIRTIGALLKDEPGEDERGDLIPSAMPEIEIDDIELHLRVIKIFLAGDSGQDQKLQNPGGYMNCIAYIRFVQSYLATFEDKQDKEEQSVETEE